MLLIVLVVSSSIETNKEIMKKSGFEKGETVIYTGKGFIGYDRAHKEMIILSKVDHCSYKVMYQHFTVEVYSHEIKAK